VADWAYLLERLVARVVFVEEHAVAVANQGADEDQCRSQEAGEQDQEVAAPAAVSDCEGGSTSVRHEIDEKFRW